MEMDVLQNLLGHFLTIFCSSRVESYRADVSATGIYAVLFHDLENFQHIKTNVVI